MCIATAKKYIGVSYLWSGSSPEMGLYLGEMTKARTLNNRSEPLVIAMFNNLRDNSKFPNACTLCDTNPAATKIKSNPVTKKNFFSSNFTVDLNNKTSITAAKIKPITAPISEKR
nr:hypothetical protein [Desulfosporosinus sp. BICA1-9]